MSPVDGDIISAGCGAHRQCRRSLGSNEAPPPARGGRPGRERTPMASESSRETCFTASKPLCAAQQDGIAPTQTFFSARKPSNAESMVWFAERKRFDARKQVFDAQKQRSNPAKKTMNRALQGIDVEKQPSNRSIMFAMHERRFAVAHFKPALQKTKPPMPD
jgi:hypothetical protein